MISKALKAALQAWLDDATSGSPSYDVRTVGLCSNLNWTQGPDVCNEFKQAIIYEFGEEARSNPFHTDYDAYCVDRRNETQHLNQARLAWVRAKLEETAA